MNDKRNTMRIGNDTLTNWRVKSKLRGVKTNCSRKTLLTRATIYKVLETGEMNVGTYALLSKFFNNIKDV